MHNQPVQPASTAAVRQCGSAPNEGSNPSSPTTVRGVLVQPPSEQALRHTSDDDLLTELEMIRGSLRPDTRSNLELARQFGEWLETVRDRSPATVSRYMSTLKAFDRWLDGGSFHDADQFQMELFQARPRVKRGYGGNGASSTRKNEVVALRGFYKWLTSRGLLDTDPTLGLFTPTVKNVNPRPVPDESWRKLWTPQSLDFQATMVLGLGALVGLRRAEMCALEGRHINVRRGLLVDFIRKGRREHTVPWRMMSEILGEKLPYEVGDTTLFEKAMRKAAKIDGLILGWEDPDQVNKFLMRITARRRVPHIHPHMLRHSAATNLLRASVPIHLVSRLLDHGSMDITMRYVKAGAAELGEWWDRQSVPSNPAGENVVER